MDILVSKELVGSKPDYVNETGTTKLASLFRTSGNSESLIYVGQNFFG